MIYPSCVFHETSYVEEDYQTHLSDILYQVIIQEKTGYLLPLIETCGKRTQSLPLSKYYATKPTTSREGYILSIDSLAIPKGASHIKEAHHLLIFYYALISRRKLA